MSIKLALVFAAINLFAATAECMAQQTTRDMATVVQMSYYALPGREQEVLNIRLSACDVLERNGVTRGRVLTRDEGPRQTKNANDPDVVWEGEFSDAASLKRYEQIAGGHPDFIAAVQKMRTVIRSPSERRYYQLRR
jgi:hypothetical protein